mgnify:CR=1 FL=1
MTKDNIFNKGYQYLLYMKNLNLQQIIDFYKSFSSPTKERRMRFYIENTGLQKNNLPEIKKKLENEFFNKRDIILNNPSIVSHLKSKL